jgi:hypothetical protein
VHVEKRNYYLILVLNNDRLRAFSFSLNLFSFLGETTLPTKSFSTDPAAAREDDNYSSTMSMVYSSSKAKWLLQKERLDSQALSHHPHDFLPDLLIGSDFPGLSSRLILGVVFFFTLLLLLGVVLLLGASNKLVPPVGRVLRSVAATRGRGLDAMGVSAARSLRWEAGSTGMLSTGEPWELGEKEPLLEGLEIEDKLSLRPWGAERERKALARIFRFRSWLSC